MRIINPEHTKAVIELVNDSPYFRHLQMKITQMEIGQATVELTMGKHHCNPFGGIHGGVYASLIDTAAYWATYCEIDEESGLTSIDVSVSDLSMLQSGKIIVEGRSIKMGHSMCLAEAAAITEAGKILAHGTSKMMILEGKQSVRQMTMAIGKRMPPKFLMGDAII